MNLLEELLKRISSKGDVGIAALGFVIGYLIDLKIALLGLTPARAGVLGLTSGIGLKNSVEALKDLAARKREAAHSERDASLARENARQELEDGVDKVMKLSAELSTEVGKAARNVVTMAARVRMDRDLWRNGLLREQNVRITVDNFIQAYRTFRESQADLQTITADSPNAIRSVTLSDD
jgi:hypothetical protein